MPRQREIAPELVLLAGEIRGLDHFALLLGQSGRLAIDHEGDRAEHQQERRQGQQNEFSPELHGCIIRNPGTGASIAVRRRAAYMYGFLSFSLSVPLESGFSLSAINPA